MNTLLHFTGSRSIAAAVLILVVSVYGFPLYSYSDSLNNSSQSKAAARERNSNYKIVTEFYPPFNFTTVSGDLTGLSVEVVKEVLNRLNIKRVPVEMMEWERALETVEKTPDTMILSIIRTKERENKLNWAGPIVQDERNLYCLNEIEGKKINYDISSLADVKRYSICVEKKGALAEYFKEKLPGKKLIYSNNARGVIEKILKFETQLSACSKMVSAYTLKLMGKSPDKLKCVYKIDRSPLYVGFNKNIPESFVNRFQKELDKFKKTKKYKVILQKYYRTNVEKVSFLN
ncbi:MAG: transporter substrate-binding domain-containing protein [Victivallales bacterium]|nr:transporter substrate-binding domain-containing protein [Victivallales bacterium]MCF7888533.1 transporter substrate-binding domain-containing protein [Victivallales bacterium]